MTGEDHDPTDLDDDRLVDAVEDAAVPAILPALAHLTGDLSLLREDLRPDPLQMLEPDAGYGPERRAAVIDVARDALRRFRDGGDRPADPPDAEALRSMVTWLTGGGDVDDHVELFEEELGLLGDLRAPSWRVEDLGVDRDVRVVIVGAGMSGLVAAHRLHQAGVEVVVVDKNPDVGGTWLENTYPGCRVDVPNHLYSYSFAPREDWPSQFSDQPALLEYFRRCADDLDLRPLIRFDTEVTAMTWCEDDAEWELHLRPGAPADPGDAPSETLRASVVVSAVGQLNRPRLPDIDGRDEFGGPAFHSARWRHDVDLRGKRVAVIGTGASAAQFVPAIADEVASLTVFQRTPPWFLPTPDYTDPLPDGLVRLFGQIPGYAAWHRLWLFWRYYEGLRPATVVDPEWDGDGRSVSAINEMVRIVLAQYLEEQFDGDPDLLAAATPDHPPAAKRMIRDDGAWARTLRSDHVELVTSDIERITTSGVVTADGTEHEVDVIVYGTGFTASDFLVPMQVTGRDGADLHETWGGDATAHLGMIVSGFPNLFLMYGPNTNIVINGSIIYFSECETTYIVDAVHRLLTGPHRSMDVHPEVQAAYAERIDAANRLSAWGASDVNSWYKNEHGRVTQNWPLSLLEFWQQTRSVDPTEYHLR